MYGDTLREKTNDVRISTIRVKLYTGKRKEEIVRIKAKGEEVAEHGTNTWKKKKNRPNDGKRG